jgi:endonuclease/exonuclease/phosphatase family metal-dependent hydrolase
MSGLRILTYNVHGLPWIRCPIQSIFVWIKFQTHADIICLQEVFAKDLEPQIHACASKYGWVAYFADALPCWGKSVLQFHRPSGLCILVKSSIPVTKPPVFTPFLSAGGVDALVTKGILALEIEVHQKKIDIVNTHFQSDFTEFPCCRISYSEIRQHQEQQLAALVHYLPFPIICGDFNQDSFLYFTSIDSKKHCTFPQTGEHLDHLLVPTTKSLPKTNITYFESVSLSDHIPVLFELDI